jgi:hypothetical protein
MNANVLAASPVVEDTWALVLECTIERSNIAQIVRDFFQKIHLETNRSKASLGFRRVLIENQPFLHIFSPQEQAQILFDVYKKTATSFIEKELEFQKSLVALQADFSLSKNQLLVFTQDFIDKEITCLYSGFPLFVISDALQESVKNINLQQPLSQNLEKAAAQIHRAASVRFTALVCLNQVERGQPNGGGCL